MVQSGRVLVLERRFSRRESASRTGLGSGEAADLLISLFGLDLWVLSSWTLGKVELLLGRPDSSLEWQNRLVERAGSSSHGYSKASGMLVAGWTASLRRDLDKARELARTARALSDEHGFTEMFSWAMWVEGYARFWQGERSAGLEQMIDAIARLDAVGSLYSSTWRLAALAEMYLELGDYRAAEETISGTISLVNRADERFCEPEVHRVAGEIIFRKPGGDLVAAEERFREAITIAQKQRARWWSVRDDVASLGCSTSRANATKRARCSRKSTAGLPKASTPPT